MFPAKVRLPRGAASALLALLICLEQSSSTDGVALASAQERPSTATATLTVRLTVAPTLPAAAREAVIREAAVIWGRCGVTLEWLPGFAGRPERDRQLRVLIIPRPGAVKENTPQDVGELLRLNDGEAVAIASIDRARHVVEKAAAPGFDPPARWSDNVLGVVLGRVVAHEIGHYLLGTSTHAGRGLMRARFTAQEFADLRFGTFALDADAAAWLAARTRASMPWDSAKAAAAESRRLFAGGGTYDRFSYRR